MNQYLERRTERSANWVFRIRIPADLLPHFHPTKEIKQSTHTADKREATHIAKRWLSELSDQWEAVRRGGTKAIEVDAIRLPVQTVSELTLQQMAQLRARVSDKFVAWDDDNRRNDQRDRREADYEGQDHWYTTIMEDATGHEGRPVDTRAADHHAAEALADLGLRAAPGSMAVANARAAFLGGLRAAMTETQRRDVQGWDFIQNAVPDAPSTLAQPVPTNAPGGHSLDDLRLLWERNKAPEESSKREAQTAVKMLDKVTGGLPATLIEKRHVIEFRDQRMATGIKSATVQKQLNLLRPIFGCAMDDGIIEVNPMDGIKAPKSKGGATKARVPFDVEDLKKLFGSGVYANRAAIRTDREEAQFWIPLLALWTGARQSELVQLRAADIGSEGGCAFMHITGGTGKRLKTESSKRRVPLHRELIKCGLLDYVKKLRDSGSARLFPAYDSAPDRAKGASFSQWFTRQRRETGITDPSKVFHSLRHGFKDACRACDIPSEHHDRMTGHGSRTVGDGYGAEFYPLKPLAKSMAKLRYAGLDLSHLHHPNPTTEIL